MFPNIKNFSLPSNIMSTKCHVCNAEHMLNSTTCAMCGNAMCRNSCSYILFGDDIKDKPWLTSYLGHNICLKCMPKTVNASQNYIKTLFAEIFSNDVENIEDEDIITEEIQMQMPDSDEYDTNEEEVYDTFIEAIILNLIEDSSLNLDMNNKLDSKSIQNVKNTFQQLLSYPLMS